jgi:hypothetical protein
VAARQSVSKIVRFLAAQRQTFRPEAAPQRVGRARAQRQEADKAKCLLAEMLGKESALLQSLQGFRGGAAQAAAGVCAES